MDLGGLVVGYGFYGLRVFYGFYGVLRSFTVFDGLSRLWGLSPG